MPFDEISPGLRARVALEKHGFKTAHALGQNFLLDDQLLSGLLDGANVTTEERVVEIGPGAGVMTAILAKRANRVIAYEMDEKLRAKHGADCSVLNGCDNVEIRIGDFLKARLDELESPYRVVANLPYYVTSDIITKLVTDANKPESITVMVQREAAERLLSSPGQKNWCALAALTRVYGDAEVLADVPRTAFEPPPHVDSCFLTIARRSDRGMTAEEEQALYRLIRAAFAMRRKKLTNNVKAAYGMTQAEAATALIDCGLDENVRGETLSIEQLIALSRRIGA